MARITVDLVKENCGILSGLLAIRVGFPTLANLTDDDVAWIVGRCLQVRKLYPTVMHVIVKKRSPVDFDIERMLAQPIMVLKENSFTTVADIYCTSSSTWILLSNMRVVTGTKETFAAFPKYKITHAICEDVTVPDLGDTNKGVSVFFHTPMLDAITGITDYRVGVYTPTAILENLYER
jgi:hypothetical protein